MTNAKRETKNDRRAHAREEARLMREKQKQTERRRRFLIQGGIGVVVIAIAVIVTLVIVQNTNNSVVSASTTAGPANMLSDGILFHGVDGKTTVVKTRALKPKEKPIPTDTKKLSSTANIVEYIDLQCPFCQEFVETNLAQEDKWVAAGKATIEIHPIAILTDPGNGGYSPRAANAVACVAAYEPNTLLAVLKTMYADQPAESTGGLPNSKIITMLSSSGASGSKVVGCVNGDSFKTWVTAATGAVTSGTFKGVATTPAAFGGTPTVFVNGVQYSGTLSDAATFAAFVDKEQPGTTGS
ncbi:MAG TPA: thioredoxin domain-containing protein [Galbitalea sp.]|nr:thioredoxin domain-containing protein [Galbitalea sp.]